MLLIHININRGTKFLKVSNVRRLSHLYLVKGLTEIPDEVPVNIFSVQREDESPNWISRHWAISTKIRVLRSVTPFCSGLLGIVSGRFTVDVLHSIVYVWKLYLFAVLRIDHFEILDLILK